MEHGLDNTKQRLRTRARLLIADEMNEIVAGMREFALGATAGTLALICILNWL